MSHHSQEEPWIQANAGDLITADNWNEVQQYAKADIKQSAEQLEEQIEEVEGKLEEVDAVKFGGKTPEEWSEQFAPEMHEHEGQTVYRRYIKRFTPDLEKALLTHELGRFPLVDVYELLPVTNREGFQECKLLFYYGHADADDYGLWVRVYRDRVPLGLPLEQLLAELGVEYEDDDTIEDVINDMWNAFMEDPNDEIEHCTTPWVDECCGQRRTVQELKDADEWADLYVAIRPRKCGKGADMMPTEDGALPPFTCQVEVTQVNYDTLHIQAQGLTENTPPLDLMFLLRI
jgi:hypothetical protein